MRFWWRELGAYHNPLPKFGNTVQG